MCTEIVIKFKASHSIKEFFSEQRCSGCPECLRRGVGGGFSRYSQLQRVQDSDSLEEEALTEPGCAPSSAWWQRGEELMGGLLHDGTAALEKVLYAEQGDADDPLICAHSVGFWSGRSAQHLCGMW